MFPERHRDLDGAKDKLLQAIFAALGHEGIKGLTVLVPDFHYSRAMGI
ncbi:MAG: hypothetical protein WBG50_27355 [Desulfomonilaceae bacterium]